MTSITPVTVVSSALLLALAACGRVKPVKIHSDPNQERLERVEERVEQDNTAAFIAAHPELDDQTKKELREGTLSRTAALERIKARKKSAD